MAIRAGAKVDAVDFDVPDPVLAYGNGTNTIVAAAFAVLPTTTCQATITNPHPTNNLLCMVALGAWLQAASGDVRAALDVTGALVVAAGLSSSTTQGWGEILYSSNTTQAQFQTVITVSLPPGATTFKVYAYRTGAGVVTCNYPTLRIAPIGYVF